MLNYKERSDSKSRENAIENKNKPNGWLKKVSVILLSCTLALLLLMPMLHAVGLEFGPEIIDEAVARSGIEAPTITKAFIGTNTISGGDLHRGKINGKNARGTVHVTLKDSSGNEKATVSVTPKSGTTWTVNLPEGVTIAEGDTVTAYQEFDGQNSPVTTANAMDSLAKQNKDKLKMPQGEIWIEQTSSNQVNKDEQAEAVQKLKDANTEIAGDIKSVKFSIDGTDHAYYEVTYTDNSTSGKIEAPDLKIKTVTETSAAPTIEKVQVTDGQIVVTLENEVAAGTKFYFVNNFTDNEDKSFCEGGKCLVDKSTSREMSQAVSIDGKKVTFPIDKVNDLKLGKEFGILVKEPHKFRSCAKKEPVVTTPKKVDVRDPHKLTDADKQAIGKAIRDANTVNGVSKLPNGTGDWDGIPTFIEFDKDGNVRIFSPNNVETEWDWSSGSPKPIYKKNDDGSYKLIEGGESEVIKIDAKDLVKNVKPEPPKIAVDTNTGKVTITPPAYENPGDDTDLASYTITYKDASDADKTVTLTRTVDATTGKTTWTSDGATVDANTGKVTLQIKDLAVGATITAKAKDNGGLIPEETQLESESASETLETVTVSYDRNGGTGNMASKKLNKGQKYTLLESTFTAPDNQEFKAWEVNGKEVAAGTEITLDKDTEIKAIWKDIMVNVSFSANGGSGEMKGATQKKGSKYTLPENSFKAPDENQEFKAWEVNGNEISAGTEITLDKDTEIKAIWKPIELKVKFQTESGATGSMEDNTVNKGSKYELPKPKFTPDEGKEFAGWKVGDSTELKQVGEKIDISGDVTLTATWKDIMVNVSYNANGGSGKMEGKELKKGTTLTLPANGFTAPENKEFKAWEVDGKEVAPGTEITVTKDTVVKAIWKEKQINVPSTPEKPNPDQPSVIDRQDGKDRIETSILISKQQYKKARTVIIVRNDLYPDALTAGLLAKVKPAPILLTPSKMLDPRVEAEIRRLGATEIIIVGGKSAISLDVEKALAPYDSDTVERLDGIDRYETATLVARKVAGLVDIRQTAIITTGENWPDALSASAFACKNNHPILLVRKNKIDQVVNRTMKDLKIGQVYLVGGPMAVSETVAKKLPKVITRIAGLNRYGTAKAVAEYGFKDAKGLYLASGQVYADALIIGPVAGQRNVPILLTQHKHLNAETKAYIEAHKPGWTTLVGGTLRIGPEVEKELKK